MQYETGKWYAWDGKQEKPECLDGAYLWVTLLDGSGDHYWEYCKSEAVSVEKDTGFSGWKHKTGTRGIIAFYVASYPKKQKEMTVTEIEKELGYSVKIVK